MSATVKTADWTRAKELKRGDMLAFPAPVFRIRNVIREGDEILVFGGPGVMRRFDPEDEVNVWKKTAGMQLPPAPPNFPELVCDIVDSVDQQQLYSVLVAIANGKPPRDMMATLEQDMAELQKTNPVRAAYIYHQLQQYSKVPKAAKTAMKVNVPESEFDHFWVEPPAGHEEFWAFRFPPKSKPGDPVIFHMNKKPVAEATISRIEKPGEHSCEQTGRFKNKWKVYWTPESFKKIGMKAASEDISPEALLVKFPGIEHDLNSVKMWAEYYAGKTLACRLAVEPMTKFLDHAIELQERQYEKPYERERTEMIVHLLEEGAPQRPVFVEDGRTIDVMEGQHRLVAFMELDYPTVPVVYVRRVSTGDKLAASTLIEPKAAPVAEDPITLAPTLP